MAVRNALGYTDARPWDPPRCTGPVAESWRDAAEKTGQKVRKAWAGYVERERHNGRIESGELRAEAEQYAVGLASLPAVPMAGSPEQYTAVAERSMVSLRGADDLLSKLGATGATVGGPGGGYLVTGAVVAGAVVAGWWLLKGDG